ncbi:hypothetical protein [Streptomyces sp. NPDC096324]|uniref:hypothetical protein n=1 Tax=Streptomyces sp. NPDC096324 TaxID=3366085 RepID=UPI0038292953
MSPESLTIPLFSPLLEQLLKAITIGVQQDLAVLKAVPDEKRFDQLVVRLNSLTATGVLSQDDAATLEDVAGGKVAATALPPTLNPDGSPSLCGVLGSTFMAPTAPNISGAGILTVGLAAAGGAAIGGGLAGPVGAVVGAALGGSIASSAVV